MASWPSTPPRARAGCSVDPAQFDCYYFAPQKSFASDGGLWLALCSPAAIERIETLAASGRWTPAFLDLKIALDNSRLNQTYNTPALATIHLLASPDQVDERQRRPRLHRRALAPVRRDPLHLGRGVGLRDALRRRTRPSAASSSAPSTSATTSTRTSVAKILRANGVVDTDPYRKLGRNQLRIAMFPSVDPEDVASLCACINYVVGNL